MTTRKTKAHLIITLLYLVLSGWWVALNVRPGVGDGEIEAFSNSIWLISFFGGIYGLMAAKKWGGFKSVFGRSISFFSLGLLAQSIGQLIYIYFDYVLHNPNPYPSVADIFFFGTIPLYILALANLAKALAIKFSKSSLVGKIATFSIPAALLGVTYMTFLNGYEKCYEDPDTLNTVCNGGLTTLLDFTYPLGGAFYISIAILIFVLSRSVLGGIMRNKVIVLLLGLLAQYAAEFHYLYLTNKDELRIGELNDLLYLTAYFIIAISIVNLGAVIDKLSGAVSKNSDVNPPESLPGNAEVKA